MSVILGAAERCEACSKRVYPMERISADGLVYHTFCFKCKECNMTLRLNNFRTHDSILLCTVHYERIDVDKRKSRVFTDSSPSSSSSFSIADSILKEVEILEAEKDSTNDNKDSLEAENDNIRDDEKGRADDEGADEKEKPVLSLASQFTKTSSSPNIGRSLGRMFSVVKTDSEVEKEGDQEREVEGRNESEDDEKDEVNENTDDVDADAGLSEISKLRMFLRKTKKTRASRMPRLHSALPEPPQQEREEEEKRMSAQAEFMKQSYQDLLREQREIEPKPEDVEPKPDETEAQTTERVQQEEDLEEELIVIGGIEDEDAADVEDEQKFTINDMGDLEEWVRRKWEQPWTKIPIAIDFPRLIKNMEVVTKSGRVITIRKGKSLLSNVEKMIECLAVQIGDDDTQTALTNSKHFATSPARRPLRDDDSSGASDHSDAESESSDIDVSVALGMFIQDSLTENNRTLRLMKSLTQTILAPPFLLLKKLFQEQSLPFVDITNKWKIIVMIGGPDQPLVVTHQKQGISQDKSFKFLWNLKLEFGWELDELIGVSLEVPMHTGADSKPPTGKLQAQVNTVIQAVRSLIVSTVKEEEEMKRKSNIRFRHKKREVSTTVSTLKRKSLLDIKPSPSRKVDASDIKFVEGIDDVERPPLYMQWGTTDTRKGKHERLLVISGYRVLFIKRIGTGDDTSDHRICSDCHIFELREISTPHPDEIILTFNGTVLEFCSSLAGDHLPDLLIRFRGLFTKYLPRSSGVEVTAHPTSRWVQPPSETLLTSGEEFLEAFKAFSDYTQPHCSPSNTFLLFVQNLQKHKTRELVISDCPGFAPNQAYTFDLGPIASALSASTYFRSLVTRDTVRKEAVKKISPCIRSNFSVTKLVLSGLMADDGFIDLGDALACNQANIIAELNLSRNNLRSSKQIEGLVYGIGNMQHITKIDLSYARLSQSGVVMLIGAIASNIHATVNLCELKLTGNDVGKYGSTAISRWFRSKLLDPPPSEAALSQTGLSSLHLRECYLDLHAITSALAESAVHTVIEVLDLSGNKSTRKEELPLFAHKCFFLHSLKLAKCHLGSLGNSLPNLVQSISQNKRLHNFGLDISWNALNSRPIVPRLASELSGAKNIIDLNLSHNGLKFKELCSIFEAASQNVYLESINLSGNKLGVGKGADLAELLSGLLSQKPTLKHLSIGAMDLKKFKMEPFFKALSKHPTLHYLDIRGNGIGDKAIGQLSEALRTNSSLTSLNWDGNNVTLEGWQVFALGIADNSSLYYIPTPNRDIKKHLSSKKSDRDRNKERARISDVFSNIKSITRENKPRMSCAVDVGISSELNPRFRESMEDCHIIVKKWGGDAGMGFFGVYDGHGGTASATFVQQHLHKKVLSEYLRLKDLDKALSSAYFKIDEQIKKLDVKAGCTSVTAILRKENIDGEPCRWLHVANCGDARAVLCRSDKTCLRLTIDHKPSEPSETARFNELKVPVINDRVAGVLAVSRAFGDNPLKPFGVTAEPYVKSLQLQQRDSILVIACDGLWDVLTDQQVCDLLQGHTDAQRMSELLLFHALESGSTDNITIMVVIL